MLLLNIFIIVVIVEMPNNGILIKTQGNKATVVWKSFILNKKYNLTSDICTQ